VPGFEEAKKFLRKHGPIYPGVPWWPCAQLEVMGLGFTHGKPGFIWFYEVKNLEVEKV